MAKICPVCNKKIGFWEVQPQPEVYTHPGCEKTFLQGPERYGGKAIEDPVQDTRYQASETISTWSIIKSVLKWMFLFGTTMTAIRWIIIFFDM